MQDALGDRMKMYEGLEASRRLMPLLPVVARIDGRCFSKFTRGMQRPYDKRLSDLMIATTKYLVQETSACCGFTQSDEITLAWYSPTMESELFFGSRVQKMCSVLAGMTTAYFNWTLDDYFAPGCGAPDYNDKLLEHVVFLSAKMPHFDCRVWSLPTLEEAANVLLWREWDATKNSIQMAAQEHYSHKKLHGKNGKEQQEMLWQKGVNWNDYPRFFRRGTFILRRKVVRPFSTLELENLPEKHEARTNPGLMVERSDYVEIDLPPLAKVINRVGVLFNGEEPLGL